eukprot:scaffold8977_cov128-Isochrysis_galbana.AAC.10
MLGPQPVEECQLGALTLLELVAHLLPAPSRRAPPRPSSRPLLAPSAPHRVGRADGAGHPRAPAAGPRAVRSGLRRLPPARPHATRAVRWRTSASAALPRPARRLRASWIAPPQSRDY